MAGGELLLAVTTAGVIALTGLAYWRAHEDDPGLTTEIALILTVILGGISVRQPALAAGVAVAVAILLAARAPSVDAISATKASVPNLILCIDVLLD